MKTSTLLFFFILLFFTAPISAQEKSKYKCAYKLLIAKDTLTHEYYRDPTYIVQINDYITKGFTYQRFYIDSLKTNNMELYRKLFRLAMTDAREKRAKGMPASEAFTSNNIISYGPFISTLYKDYKKEEMRVVDNIGMTQFVFSDELQPQDWEIQTDTMTILGYHSQKATCHYRGRDWIAWFTSEIPISEGPWKFYGLPGLITKVADDKEHYSFTLTGFQEIEESIDVDLSSKIEKTTRKDFIEASKKGEIQKMEMESVGLNSMANKKEIGNQSDYIETDYKEWEKGK